MTYHSIVRTRERANVPKKAAAKVIERAKQRGIKSSEMPAKERRYLNDLQNDGIKFLYYNGYLYLLNAISNVCITMYAAPEWFLSGCNFSGKDEVRKPKKYMRCYGYKEYI